MKLTNSLVAIGLTKALFIVAAVCTLAIACIAACNKQQRVQAGNDAVALGDAGCVLLEDVVDSGTVDKTCATIEDLLPLLPTILAIQHARAAGATKAQIRARFGAVLQ